jgi:3-hydroxybutyryl-CoA dehydrogenase
MSTGHSHVDHLPISSIGVVGAGQMGTGIAQVAAEAGYAVYLVDANPATITHGMMVIDNNLNRAADKGRISKEDAAIARQLIRPGATFENLSSCELVIEAITEDFEAKASVIRQVHAVLPLRSIIASNTSSISITKLAALTKRPGQVIGMHFMNPVPVMTLVEVIRGMQTSDATYNTVVEVARRMGKTTVLGVDSAGFIVNRILAPMLNEAIFLFQEGVAATDIDTAMKLGTNQPMGPLALADFIGLDTVLNILRVLHRELGDDKYRPCPLLVRYVDAGYLGKKAKRGFYSY